MTASGDSDGETAARPGERLVAILRGVKPDEIEGITRALAGAGVTTAEIPLNSPEPLKSIEIAANVMKEMQPELGLVGAGTVLAAHEVDEVWQAGGRLVVAPNTDAEVIERALERGMRMMPGVMTPSEAFAAIAAGARELKFFPASLIGPEGLAAIKAVLPKDVRMFAVGGVRHEDFAAYLDAGVHGFGLGGSLYRPGDDAASVAAGARTCLEALEGLLA